MKDDQLKNKLERYKKFFIDNNISNTTSNKIITLIDTFLYSQNRQIQKESLEDLNNIFKVPNIKDDPYIKDLRNEIEHWLQQCVVKNKEIKVDTEALIKKIQELINNCDKETINTANRTLDYIKQGINFQVINANTGRIGNIYPDLAFYLSELAYQLHNDNEYFLTRYTRYLKERNEPNKVVEIINEFDKRKKIDDILMETRIIIKIMLASCYKDLEDYAKAIKSIENLPLDGEPGRTYLQPRILKVELYSLIGDYDNSIKLITTSPELTPRLRIEGARIYKKLGEFKKGLEIIKPIKDNKKYLAAKELYDLMSENEQTSENIPSSENIVSKVKIFISHTSKDEALTKALVELLEVALSLEVSDIRCTSVPGYKLQIGTHTSSTLKNEIQYAKVVIGVVTPDSLKSNYVLFELGASWGLDITTLPVLAKGAMFESLPGPLKEHHAISLGDSTNCYQLIDDIASKTGLTKTDVMPRVNGKINDLVAVAK